MQCRPIALVTLLLDPGVPDQGKYEGEKEKKEEEVGAVGKILYLQALGSCAPANVRARLRSSGNSHSRKPGADLSDSASIMGKVSYFKDRLGISKRTFG